MAEYIVSARKYRPQTFDSVIGQQALTRTLKNAIANHHLAHAYLFCGPRGVGKTTCARIFAKTINCAHPNENGEACNQCESCTSFNEGRSFNIHELDAASNNSVDDIRALVDQVRIPPQIGKYSVYIVDEVHMLSQAAFNAFLKTLEEPPAHAIFILATTEKHKILPTILSRCQIYDFNRIKVDDTIEYLQKVAANEGIDAEVEALNVIAQKADGAMRDALSIFDQVTSFCGNHITYAEAIKNLNVLDYDYFFRTVDALREGDVRQAFLIFDDVLNKGFEGQHFISGLASHFRDLLMSRDEATLPLLEVSQSIAAKYKAQAAQCAPAWLYRAIDLATDTDINYRLSRNKRLHVEAALIRLATIDLTQPKKAESELPVISKSVVASTPTTVSAQPNPATTVPAPVSAPAPEPRPQTAPVITTVNSAVLGALGIPSLAAKPAAPQSAPAPAASSAPAPEVKPMPLDAQRLRKAWAYIAETRADDDYTRKIFSYPPVVTGDHQITVALLNEVQLKTIQRFDPYIRDLLARGFRRRDIEIVYTISAPVGVDESVLMSDEQKLAKLQENNSEFKNLLQELQLEII